MNNPRSRKPNILPSISDTFHYLFIGERDSSYLYWFLGAITLIGLVMRLWKLNEPIAYDEAYTFIYYATRPFRQILSDYSAPNNHILHTIFVRLSYWILGGHTWIVRVPALVAGTLCIPAAYFTSRRIFDPHQSLAAAALVALTPWFISYSTNGRGYTLLMLFTLLLTNFAGILVREQSRTALIAYGITGALGFYTIPIFLYPMAGVTLWVLATYLTDPEHRHLRFRNIAALLVTCALSGLLTLLLYSPVILFGTGAGSIVGNEFVEARDGGAYVENLVPRALKTWETWMQGIIVPVQYLLVSGFAASMFFYRKASRQRLPLPVFLVLAILVLIIIQRVAPLARVWIYLELFYMLFAGAGLAWLVDIFVRNRGFITSSEKFVSGVVLLSVIVVLAVHYLDTLEISARNDVDDSPEQYGAEYLASHLQAQDTILSVAPVDIMTAYYLYLGGVPYEVFYRRDHPIPIENALIVLRKNSRYNTPEDVLDFYELTPTFDLQTAELVFEYGPLNIFSVSSK